MNLLLIDDDEELAQRIGAYLRGHGISVKSMQDGTQGLAKAIAGRHDLILLDGMLPGLDTGADDYLA